MTGSPADLLATARLNPVGPYLTPEDGWLKGWTGPVAEPYTDDAGRACHADLVLFAFDARAHCVTENGDYVTRTVDGLRLDTRRPEVRHRLVDLGIAPEWARGSAVACWCAGMGVKVSNLLFAPVRPPTAIAALRNGKVVEADGGYYVPLADGGFGWWADE